MIYKKGSLSSVNSACYQKKKKKYGYSLDLDA